VFINHNKYSSQYLNFTNFLDVVPHLAADPYCKVKYEGGTLENHYKAETLNPEWDDRVTLYRKNPYKDITIEV